VKRASCKNTFVDVSKSIWRCGINGRNNCRLQMAWHFRQFPHCCPGCREGGRIQNLIPRLLCSIPRTVVP
jgi:hypothetical protein